MKKRRTPKRSRPSILTIIRTNTADCLKKGSETMGVAKYAYNANKALSRNFCAAEFRCKCGRTHDTLISSELVINLQRLVDALGASKAIITSGYRCPAHDRAVGGNGSGQHTKGTAADVIFYDRNGYAINTRLVACKAQDLGFNGIANIDKTYHYIHLDVRTGSKWYGDEVKGTSYSVTNDFYAYYGISRSDSGIKALQQALNSEGEKLAVDGILGGKTLTAAKKRIIDTGSKGEVVKWVQQRLTDKGYPCGAVDGIAGTLTMKAINTWQKANNVGVGYFGGSDWDIFLK